jgi:hypothetical protein
MPVPSAMTSYLVVGWMHTDMPLLLGLIVAETWPRLVSELTG